MTYFNPLDPFGEWFAKCANLRRKKNPPAFTRMKLVLKRNDICELYEVFQTSSGIGIYYVTLGGRITCGRRFGYVTILTDKIRERFNITEDIRFVLFVPDWITLSSKVQITNVFVCLPIATIDKQGAKIDKARVVSCFKAGTGRVIDDDKGELGAIFSQLVQEKEEKKDNGVEVEKTKKAKVKKEVKVEEVKETCPEKVSPDQKQSTETPPSSVQGRSDLSPSQELQNNNGAPGVDNVSDHPTDQAQADVVNPAGMGDCYQDPFENDPLGFGFDLFSNYNGPEPNEINFDPPCFDSFEHEEQNH